MLSLFRALIPPRSPLRLGYHKLSAMAAAFFYRFPGNELKIIGVTGTSGKSTTVELIHYLMQSGGKKCGALSTINFHLGDEVLPNVSLRTTLRPWKTQQMLRKMVKMGLEYCVLEVSSHALDQHRLWGVSVDTAVLVNIRDNEHLDYHGNLAEYIRAKTLLFRGLNLSYRKPRVPKVSILNQDDEHCHIFESIPSDRVVKYSTHKPADVRAKNIRLSESESKFTLEMPNHSVDVALPLLGKHNIENLLAAVGVATSFGVGVDKIAESLTHFPGISGRLEVVSRGLPYSVVVDFSYKPSALQAVLSTLKTFVKGRIIVVWGGAGERSPSNWKASVEVLHKLADEIILTTDDPLSDDPKEIALVIRSALPRQEGEGFFEIEDRYEAIRYAILTAEKGDLVLVAGRGHEQTQTIGKKTIPFDDREVCREILGAVL